MDTGPPAVCWVTVSICLSVGSNAASSHSDFTASRPTTARQQSEVRHMTENGEDLTPAWHIMDQYGDKSFHAINCTTATHNNNLLRLGTSSSSATRHIGQQLYSSQPVHCGVFNFLPTDSDPLQVFLKCFAPCQLQASTSSPATCWSPCNGNSDWPVKGYT